MKLTADNHANHCPHNKIAFLRFPLQCLCPLYSVEGWKITTVEGIGRYVGQIEVLALTIVTIIINN